MIASSCHMLKVRPLTPRNTAKLSRGHLQPVRAVKAKASSKSDVLTLLLDCDGVLVDTEAQGHRVSFNEAFKRKGWFTSHWSY